MNDDDLNSLRVMSVSDIKDTLPDLNADELQRLCDMEAAGEKRKGVLEAIDKMLAELSPQTEQPTAKQARGEEAPAWQKEEYNGPLSCDQAQWRLSNLQRK